MRSEIERDWVSEHGGLRCVVVGSDMGHRCGYVCVPEGHPWHGLDYSDEVPDPRSLDEEVTVEEAMEDHGTITVFAAREPDLRTLVFQVKVHGGLTYSGESVAELEKGWWLGFDCAHAGDRKDPALMSETMREIERDFPPDPDEKIWTEEGVAAECERLAEQIAAAAS